MMAITLQQQVSSATQLQLEHQLALWTAIHGTLLDGVAKLAALNMQAIRESIDESHALASQWGEPGRPQDIFSSAPMRMPPNLERLTSYGKQLTDIASEIRMGFAKVMQDEMAEANRQAAASMQDLLRQIPGSDSQFTAWLQSAADAGDAAYEQVIAVTAHMTKSIEDATTSPTAIPSAETDKTRGRRR